MNRPLALGFLYGAATPVVLACITAALFVGGNPAAVLFSTFIAISITAPVAGIITLVFGVPLYFSFCRRGVTSLAAYVATGFALSAPITAFLLWEEYTGGYRSASQALLDHISQFVILVSGPAAATVFWLAVRPDLQAAGLPTERAIAHRKNLRLAAAVFGFAFAGYLIYGAYSSPKSSDSKTPLATQRFEFDSAKSSALIEALKTYAISHDANLVYFFMPKHSEIGGILLSVRLKFPSGIEIGLSNPYKELQAFVYSETSTASELSDRIWSEFLSFLPAAVESANALPQHSLPAVPSRGEAGRIEPRPWWDWRFQR